MVHPLRYLQITRDRGQVKCAMTILNCRSSALIMNRMLCSTVSVIKRTIGEHSFQPTKPGRRCDLLGGKWLVLIRSVSPPRGQRQLPPRLPEIEPRCREAP